MRILAQINVMSPSPERLNVTLCYMAFITFLGIPLLNGRDI